MPKSKVDPHFVVTDFGGGVHVIPKSFFIAVAKGETEFSALDGHKKIIQAILVEWMLYVESLPKEEIDDAETD